MIPIGDDNSGRRLTPVVTYALIAINVLFFLVELSGGDAFIMQWAYIPAQFLADPIGELPTVLTSMFMHAGWMHLIGNMVYLWIFGDNVEDRLGHSLFLVFYLVCGLAATALQTFFSMNSSIPNVGASGAIAGILGAYLLMFPRQRVQVLMGRAVVPMSALIVIGFWFVLQLFSGFSSITTAAQDGGGVAYMAHVGGFIAGAALTFLLGGTRRQSLPPPGYRY